MKMISLENIAALIALCFFGGSFSLKSYKDPPVLLKISELENCQSEISEFCKDKLLNNFEVLTCLHNNLPINVELSEPCQHDLWQAKYNLTKAVSFFINGISAQSCENDINKITDCKLEKEADGPVIPCLIEFRDQITDVTCRKYLDFLKPLIFTDYRLTYKFIDRCSSDIDFLHCGRTINKRVGDQGSTIDCLSESYDKLSQLCKHEILKLSGLQSDDWTSDRPLYLACREDRERLCSDVPSGNGLIYDCLYRNKMNPDMSDKCAEKLRLRQKLQQTDYSVDFKFEASCKSDIERHRCDPSEDANEGSHVTTSKIILCLEEAKLEGRSVSPNCLAEVKSFRFRLMEDHKINPEVTAYCIEEVKECEREAGKQGYVVHCLMDRARNGLKNGREMSPSCLDAVENLLVEVDVGSDYDVDPALVQDCNEEINSKCRDVEEGGGSVIDCLMELINKEHGMSENCLDRLMEIQYFFSRSFKFSRKMVVQCRQDARKICSKDLNDTSIREDSHLLSCLYRNREKTTKRCMREIRRLMENRARSIDLPPSVQESCISDLGAHCSEKLGRDEEMFCLEDNYDLLSERCKEAVSEEVDMEETAPSLTRIFLDSCDGFIKRYCENKEKEMDCLISNKNHPEMSSKCKAGVSHHQLMLMKEVKLSRAFREACDSELDRFCQGSRKKLEMVKCLSEHVYNDTMLDGTQRIDGRCRRRLDFELLQIGESMELDDKLWTSCSLDRKKFCGNIESGNAKVVECLKQNQEKLQKNCRELIFKRELIEAVDSSVDYILISKCKTMIKKHCREDEGKIFECLKQHRKDDNFDEECHSVVVSRMRLRSEDVRLNPVLYKSCRKDIEKHCSEQMEAASRSSIEMEGLVIYCLRMVFVHRIQGAQMTSSCTRHISELIKDSAIDYLQDPALVEACRPVLETKCLKEVERHKLDENGSEVEECLRESIMADQETRDRHPKCFVEILRRLNENKVDVQIDPILYRLCQLEAKAICQGVRRGEGRVMSCLLSAALSPSMPMNNECREALKKRSELWSLAVKIAPPDDMGELYSHIQSSSSRLYFQCIFFTAFCLVFFIGLYCGRITKRQQQQQLKNK